MINLFRSIQHRSLLCHFAICALGLVALIQSIAAKVGIILDYKYSIWISYSDSYVSVINALKPASLFQYIFTIIFLALYFAIVAIVISKVRLQFICSFFTTKFSSKIFLGYLVILLIFNGVLFVASSVTLHKLTIVGAVFFIWVSLVFLPFFPFYIIWLKRFGATAVKAGNVLAYILLIFLMIQTVILFLPYVGSGKLKISNDYFGVPEQTLLNGGYINNNDYIKAHHIGGLFDVSFSNSSTISSSLNRLSGAWKNDVGTMESDSLEALYCKHLDKNQCITLLNNAFISLAGKKQYTKEERDFIAKNTYEIKTQEIAGHYFHHQNALLGPINEYILGKPLNKIIFLYGYGNSIFIAKLTQIMGGFNFQNYTKVLFAFYPIYYVLLIFISAILFRNIWYVLLVALLSLASLQFIGFESIRYAPGNDPIRHFLDLFVIMGFYQYLCAKRYQIIYLSLTFLFALLAIFANKEFGAIIFISLTIAFILHFIYRRRNVFDLLIFIAATICAYKIGSFLTTLGQDSLAIYGFLGVSVPPTSKIIAFAISLMILLLYSVFLVTFLSGEHKKNWYYLALFLFFYFQGNLVYFIWYTEPAHFLTLNSIYALLFVLLLKQGFSNINSADLREGIIKFIVLVVLCLFYLPLLYLYYSTWRNYEKIFETHRVYAWNFPTANFLSTMDPAPFENSIKLIDQYSKKPEIYIISQYDNFLPFLAGKYSAMPFIQLDLSLVTKTEVNQAIEAIKTDKPKYIFIDTDINQDHFESILNSNDPFTISLGQEKAAYYLSLGRALTILNLRMVFSEIQADYKPIEAGDLITVYQRRNV